MSEEHKPGGLNTGVLAAGAIVTALVGLLFAGTQTGAQNDANNVANLAAVIADQEAAAEDRDRIRELVAEERNRAAADNDDLQDALSGQLQRIVTDRIQPQIDDNESETDVAIARINELESRLARLEGIIADNDLP